jgi:hypothetical protein
MRADHRVQLDDEVACVAQDVVSIISPPEDGRFIDVIMRALASELRRLGAKQEDVRRIVSAEVLRALYEMPVVDRERLAAREDGATLADDALERFREHMNR